MQNSILYQIKRLLFTFIGDIKWSGILRPMWFTINAPTFRLKGKHYRSLENIIHHGDILIRRFEGYVDKWFIPGWWNHAGIYVGTMDNKPHKIIHAISDGIVVEDLIDFMRTDHMIVLRPKNPETILEAVRRAKSVVGHQYDFSFDFCETVRFSCTELIDYCYPETIEKKKRLGRLTIVADDIVGTQAFSVVWDSRNTER